MEYLAAFVIGMFLSEIYGIKSHKFWASIFIVSAIISLIKTA